MLFREGWSDLTLPKKGIWPMPRIFGWSDNVFKGWGGGWMVISHIWSIFLSEGARDYDVWSKILRDNIRKISDIYQSPLRHFATCQEQQRQQKWGKNYFGTSFFARSYEICSIFFKKWLFFQKACHVVWIQRSKTYFEIWIYCTKSLDEKVHMTILR